MPRHRADPEAPLSPLAGRIVARAGALGLHQAAVARRAGLLPQVLSRLLCGQQADLRDDERLARLARALETTPAWLVGSVADPAIPVTPPRRAVRAPIRPRRPPTPDEIAAYEDDAQYDAEERALQAEEPIEGLILSALARPFCGAPTALEASAQRALIPRYGAGANGRVALDSPVASLTRPTLLIGRAGAYAVVAGPGLEPRYSARETLFIAPGLLARLDDWVIAISADRDGSGRFGLVGRLVGLTRARAVLSSATGADPIVLGIAGLTALHPIVLAGEADLDGYAAAL